MGMDALSTRISQQSYWSLIHEAIHDLFHPERRVNAFFGRALSILFGSPFQILRLSHLLQTSSIERRWKLPSFTSAAKVRAP
jgi:hypothetical protein